jgi:rhodanese-related sulfurtransferase
VSIRVALKRQPWYQTGILLTLASLAGVLANTCRSSPLPWIVDVSLSLNPAENPALADQAYITLDELREHLEYGTAMFLDVRKTNEFRKGHLPTALNVPANEKERHLDTIFRMLPKEELIVIYCKTGACDPSGEVFEFLVRSGYSIENLRIFEPGWPGLLKAGVPIVEGDQ